MDAATTKFVIMVSVVVLSSVAGYMSRVRGWVAERHAKPITFWVMVLGYPATGMLGVWVLRLQWSDTWVLVQPVILMAAMFGVGLLVAKRLKLPGPAMGVFAYAAGLSNIGFTMGGFICLRLYGPEGLAYALVYLLLWTVVFYGVFFPLAGRFAGRAERYTVATFVRNLIDLKCLPLLGIVAGIVLSLLGIDRPAVFSDYYIVDVLVMICTAVMFFVTALRLHVTHLMDNLNLYAWLAGIKFVLTPVAAIALLALVRALGMDLGALPYKVMIVESTMPAALFAVMVANLYDLDARLASALFVANTAMFLVLVLPILTFVMG